MLSSCDILLCFAKTAWKCRPLCASMCSQSTRALTCIIGVRAHTHEHTHIHTNPHTRTHTRSYTHSHHHTHTHACMYPYTTHLSHRHAHALLAQAPGLAVLDLSQNSELGNDALCACARLIGGVQHKTMTTLRMVNCGISASGLQMQVGPMCTFL